MFRLHVEKTMLPKGALKHKVAIITGGGTGLGKAMAIEFAKLGAHIVIASRNKENLETAAEEIGKYSTQVLAVPTDVRDYDQVQNMVQKTVDTFGGIHILVNNAGANFKVPALEMSKNAWNAVVNIVLNGTWYCSQLVGRQMAKQGGGVILNIGSVSAWNGRPLNAHSSAAKAGVLALTRTLAVEWAPYGIRVNMLTPGPIEGTGAAVQLWNSPEEAQRVVEGIPLKRFGTKQELASLASYLVSDYAAFVTGACFVMDGGGWLNKVRF